MSSCCLKCREKTDSKKTEDYKNKKRKNNGFIKLCGLQLPFLRDLLRNKNLVE